MKSILYVGATLMIGASIYGFVDYKKTSRNKEFTNMYEEVKTKEPVVITSDKTAEPVVKKSLPAEGMESIAAAKIAVTKKQAVSKKESNVSVRPIAEDEKMDTREIKEIEKPTTAIKTSNESGIEKRIMKKRKFSTKLFSRGALDERYTEKKVKTGEIRETKKVEIKE